VFCYYQEAPEPGAIESMELVNFMCHKYLKMNFGSKINFVIGHNGSKCRKCQTAMVVLSLMMVWYQVERVLS
jgi:hypothetical protein